MKKRLPVVAALLAVAMLFGACFSIRGFKWTVNKIKRGEKGVLVLHTKPNTQDEERAYVFFMLGVVDPPNEPDPVAPYMKIVTPRKFDVKGKFGGPYTLVRDDGMRDDIIANDMCPQVGGYEGHKWVLYRTTTRVRNHGAIWKTAEARFGVKATSEASGLQTVKAGSGAWHDGDGDGEYTELSPPEGDMAACSSGIVTNIPAGPINPSPAPSSMKEFRDLIE